MAYERSSVEGAGLSISAPQATPPATDLQTRVRLGLVRCQLLLRLRLLSSLVIFVVFGLLFGALRMCIFLSILT